MAIFKYNKFTTVAEVSKLKVTIEEKALKLTEETGEVAQEVLKYVNCKNASKSAEGSREKIIEEVSDVILVAYDLIYHLDGEKEFKETLQKKIDKWYNKFNKE